MAKKYVIKSFNPGEKGHNRVNPLINLSSFGLSTNQSIVKNALALGASSTQSGIADDQMNPSYYGNAGNNLFNRYKDLTKNNSQSYAFYDMTYSTRCQMCKQLARDIEINFILETICNEAIVPDENGFIAQLDLDKLKLFLNKRFKNNNGLDADKLIRDCKIAYNKVYAAFGWASNNGAWTYFKKFLIEGFLAFEIIMDENKKNIIGIMNIDPTTLQPDIQITEDGQELFIWYQYKGAANQRMIPNSNLIYISWANLGDNKYNNISYVEGLTRSFNMLRQLENSHLIWNIQNAQNRMKITVPVNDLSPAKAQQRIGEIINAYTEEVSMDDLSGQMLVNGEPKFNFQKTFVFEDHGGQAVTMEGVKAEGYNMNTTEDLQYFWRKFILESQVPANRFTLNISSAPNNQWAGDANITREEYAFGRFIERIQAVFKEILLKPLLVQICAMHPEFSYTDYLKQGLGIRFNEENMFVLAKKRSVVNEGAAAVSTLMGIMSADGQTPYFSIDWAVKEFLGLSDQDLETNRQYKEAEIIRNIKIAKLQKKHADEALANTPQNNGGVAEGGGFNAPDMSGGGFGGDMSSDMGGGDVMSGGEFGGPDMGGGDMGGAEAPAPEAPAPEPAPEAPAPEA